MRPLLRVLPMALVYAVLAGPSEPLNWLFGVILGYGVAFLMRGPARAITPGEVLRAAVRPLLLPWFLLGCVVTIAGGCWTMMRVLLFQAGRTELGFARCRTEAETDEGMALLALIETASPNSIVASLDGRELRISLVPAGRREKHCAGQRRWYRRFQRRMLP